MAYFQRMPGELTGEAAQELRSRQAAVLAMHAAYCLPLEGQVISKKSETIKELAAFRRPLPKKDARPRVSLEKAGASRARADALDGLMARAHFQREPGSERSEREWEFSAAGAPATSAALLGKKNRELPQIEGAKLRGFDDRETLAWMGRLLTKKKGQARIQLPLGDVPGAPGPGHSGLLRRRADLAESRVLGRAALRGQDGQSCGIVHWRRVQSRALNYDEVKEPIS
jgi:hypothetical protein